MDFIAKTPPELYFLVPAGGNLYYGFFLYDDMVEYLTNEFLVDAVQLLGSVEVKKTANIPGCKIWGNQELVHF